MLTSASPILPVHVVDSPWNGPALISVILSSLSLLIVGIFSALAYRSQVSTNELLEALDKHTNRLKDTTERMNLLSLQNDKLSTLSHCNTLLMICAELKAADEDNQRPLKVRLLYAHSVFDTFMVFSAHLLSQHRGPDELLQKLFSARSTYVGMLTIMQGNNPEEVKRQALSNVVASLSVAQPFILSLAKGLAKDIESLAAAIRTSFPEEFWRLHHIEDHDTTTSTPLAEGTS